MKHSLSAAVGFLLASAACAAVPQIPIETLFGTNYIRSAILSPDGARVAFLAPSQGTYGLVLLDLATHKVTNPVHIEGEDINSIAWKGSDHLIFTGIISGNENGPQVASTDLEGKRVFSLLKAQKDKMIFSVFSGQVISARKTDPGQIYAIGYTTDSDFKDEDQDGNAMIIRVNVINGKRALVCNIGEGDTRTSLDDFGVDRDGQVRTANRSIGDFTEFVYRNKTTDPWKAIRRFTAKAAGWDVLGFEGDGPGVFIVDHESSDVGALRVFDPATETLGPALFTPEDGAIDDLIFSPDRMRLLGVTYTTDKSHFHWFDSKYAKLWARLETSFPGQEVDLITISDDESKILLRTRSDRELGAYYLLDMSKGSMGLVTTVGPKINPGEHGADDTHLICGEGWANHPRVSDPSPRGGPRKTRPSDHPSSRRPVWDPG